MDVKPNGNAISIQFNTLEHSPTTNECRLTGVVLQTLTKL